MVSVILYPCMFVLLCQWICLFCVLRVCELFGETIPNTFGCVCYFVVKCDGVLKCGWRSSIGYTIYGLPKNVCVMPVVSVSV